MPYFMIDDLKAGLDVTQPAFKAPAGTLRVAINGHITRGGDFEKRKAFVPKFLLPAGTLGMAEAGGSIYVYGSIAAPAVPPGVIYVRLLHPLASPMVEILQTELFNGKVYAVALYDNGDTLHWYDGVQVTDWFDGRARGSFEISGGLTGTITSVKVDGVEVMGGAAIPWTTSNSNTAALIAAQVNSYVSVPNYGAVAIGSVVYIQAPPGLGSTDNGLVLAVIVTGDFTTTVPSALADGVTSVTAFEPGPTVRTHRNKMYALSGVNMHYSGIGDPVHYQTSYTGAGASNLSNESAGAELLVGLEAYFRKLAVFAKRHFQIWTVDADPSQYAVDQVTRGVGLVASRAVTAYVDSGVYFLSELGYRAIEQKYLTGQAGLVDIGVSIDTLVTAHMATQTQDVLDRALMAIEPQEGRVWGVVGDRIWVHSVFPRKSISAWSEYRPGFVITEIVVQEKKLYARSGDTIYLYGGDSGDEYGADYETSALLPYVTARAPATFKDLKGLDVGVEGEWTVYLYPDLNDQTIHEAVTISDGPTFNRETIDVVGYATHFSVGVTHQKAEYARFSSVALHYDKGEAA